MLFSLNVYVYLRFNFFFSYFLAFSTDKDFITKNINLVTVPHLNRILRSEIFLHTDSQFYATHVILGFTPISTWFQSLKHVIKAHDPRLAKINVVVKEFVRLPPEGTFQVALNS